MSVEDADVEDDAGKTEGVGGTDIARAYRRGARRLLVGDYLPKVERCVERLTDEQV